MYWRNSCIAILLIFLTSCKDQKDKIVSDTSVRVLDTSEVIDTYKNKTHIIEAETLLGSLNDPKLKIIDFRKQEDFKNGHIPNSLCVYRSDIEDSTYPYKGMMASKKTIETLFSELGINNGDTLVVYDDRGGCDATRLWWVLQNYDYTKVKIINGGLRAWIAANGPITSKEAVIEVSNFVLPNNGDTSLKIERQDLKTMMAKKNEILFLDVRTNDEYSGKRQKKGAAKAGRIPNSKLIDWSYAIDYRGTHKFRSYKELEVLYKEKLGVSKEDLIITYCHSGVRSAHTTFVLTELLGYTNVKNYDGSWSEWSYFNDLPIKKDSITRILE
jgi:thiosulfate/3-mercaptopyruvate sulfurtransferase